MWLLLAGGLSWPPGFGYAYERRRDGREDNGEDHDGEDSDGEDHDGEVKNGEVDGSDDIEENGGEDDDQNLALDAVRNDHAASLREVLAIVREQHEGEIVHVSLSGSKPNLIYHIKILDSSDHLIDLQIDPLSRKIVPVEGS